MSRPNVLEVRSAYTNAGVSSCLRCARRWDQVPLHSTEYGTRLRGCFPLCEGCWNDLTPERRLPYYEILVLEVWDAPDDWPDVCSAVLGEA